MTRNGNTRSGCSAKHHVAGVARRSVKERWKGKIKKEGSVYIKDASSLVDKSVVSV